MQHCPECRGLIRPPQLSTSCSRREIYECMDCGRVWEIVTKTSATDTDELALIGIPSITADASTYQP
jgi:hypothetical protein